LEGGIGRERHRAEGERGEERGKQAHHAPISGVAKKVPFTIGTAATVLPAIVRQNAGRHAFKGIAQDRGALGFVGHALAPGAERLGDLPREPHSGGHDRPVAIELGGPKVVRHRLSAFLGNGGEHIA
jgi:hypothetical protein